MRAAQCALVSRIGTRIDAPWLAHVAIAAEDGALGPERAARVRELTGDALAAVPRLADALLDGRIGLDRWPFATHQ